MPYYHYEDEWHNADIDGSCPDDTDEDDYNDNESYLSESEEARGGWDSCNEWFPIKQPVWKHVCIGGKTYMVSNHGRIRPESSLFEVSKGLEDNGSPYMTYTFITENNVPKTYFMHDIVWQAFNGVPPDGWEVAHTSDEASRRRRHYSNSLAKLTIVPIRVSNRPKSIFI